MSKKQWAISKKKIRKFFKSKKIVYHIRLSPGELVKIFTHNGKKYVRIAFTNRVKFKGTMPVTDVLFSSVTGIRKLPSPFKKWVFGLVKKNARATYYKIDHRLKK